MSMEDTEEAIDDLVDPDSEESQAETAAGERVAGRVGVRSARAYARFGSALTLTDIATSGTFPFNALVRVLVFQEMAANFTQTDTDTWARPIYKLSVGGDFRTVGDGPFAGDTVALPDGAGAPGDTLDYEVRKVDRIYIGSVATRTILYVAIDAAP